MVQAVPTADAPLDLGSRRELFVDRYLIEKLDNVRLKLHEPRDEGEVLRYDAPWEGQFCGYCTVIRDGDTFRLYYRGKAAGRDGTGEVTCYAESKDGQHWAKPKLGLCEVAGSKDNNVILDEAGVTHNFSPFLDTRPDVPTNERFKALGGVHDSKNPSGGLMALASADGIHWRPFHNTAVITRGAFDSQNVAFWSPTEQCYVCFFRIFTSGVTTATEWKVAGLRSVSRATSSDFIHWSQPERMRWEPPQEVHIYISQTHPYFRAPHIYLATAARFMQGRQAITEEEAKQINVSPGYFLDVSDAVLLTSRDGHTYQQTFREALIRPGLRPNEWVSRTGYPALNVVQTGPNEMSLYTNQDYAQPSAHLRRYSLRLDGFASINAPYEAGEFITKPLRFAGRNLKLNYATSAAGSIRVEIQDAQGVPLPGYTADDCVALLGNRIEQAVGWKGGHDLSALAGQTVRLRFLMRDADLYSLQFTP
ncbi:MAG: hypothetical protein JSS27_14295 [Planctomycetes bacterium]|nr:hypothetical protein [Planctomycetota bacterium]